MKSQVEYFRRKNSKHGIALSTAMAICIVLAILVAVLVSMASLNITTTQATVNQREAYITAKSALAFAESYYSQHDIPGKEDPAGGSALIVFNEEVVSEGAKVYVVQDGASATGVDVDALKAACKRTYVDVLKSGDYLDLTAHCKYDDGNFYELSKEFALGGDNVVRPNSFTGNVSYQGKSETRYLRIHVRTNPAFGDQPLLWTWYTTVNKDSGEKEYGKSSIVNKMASDDKYTTVTNGTWNTSTNGPVGNVAMQYEGNSWYVTELTFSSDQDVNFVNAIVTRANALRSSGNNAQSWEFFGIPVPSADSAGEAGGLDVYITLNRNELRDARNCDDAGNSTDDSTAKNDEFTHIFEADCGGDINEFAKFCGSWYNVYTKKNLATMHYRKQGVYDESANPNNPSDPVFDYEGYGWWRWNSNNFGDSFKGFTMDSLYTISQNEYGKEVVKEGFICEFSDGTVSKFDTEAEANEAFADAGEGERAGEYLTVNVKAARQPVDVKVDTTIEYASKWDKGTTPAAGGSGGSDPEPTAKSSNNELEFEKVDWTPDFAIIGDPFNDWGRDPGTDESRPHYYQNLLKDKLTPKGNYLYTREYTDCEARTYSFKVAELIQTSGTFEDNDGWSKAYPNKGNYDVEVTKPGNTLVITYNSFSHEITAEEKDPEGPIDGSQTYAVAGWLNSFGETKDNTTYTPPAFEGTHEMTFDSDAQCYVFTTDPTTTTIESGKQYEFKILLTTGKSGAISDDDWNESYGGNGQADTGSGAETVKGTGASNYIYMPPTIDGNPATYRLEIRFDPRQRKIWVVPYPTGAAGERFFLIGANNSWADNHKFNRATSSMYEMESTGTTDLKGRFLYKLTPTDAFPPGTYEVKVISSNSLKAGMDGDSENSIDYDKSWGAYGSEDSNCGSDKAAYSFTLENESKVEFTFAYDGTNTVSCPITHTTVASADIKYSTVKFYNAKGKDENNNDSDFTTPWTELYVTYVREGSVLPKCVQVTFSAGTKTIPCSIPRDTTKFYFSNMNSTTDRTNENYQRTQDIEFKTGVANKTFRPTHYVASTESNAPDGKWWAMTSSSTRNVDDETGTGTMVYTGSAQNNYYDAPLVRVLMMLASGSSSTGTKYAFSPYPYDSIKIPTGRKVSFKNCPTVTYQGETYYYKANENAYGYSYLIVCDSNKTYNSSGWKGGLLLENHMALMTKTQGVGTKMNNRAGGVFTSDAKYYDESESKFNYGGYTPNWYTFKIPVTTETKIIKIHGVVGDEDIFTSDQYFTPANATDYYKQPLYISQEYANNSGDAQTERFYTYNTNIGTVDTSTTNEVSVYFANSGSGDAHFDKVAVYAYNPLGDEDKKTINSTDGSDADHNYYRYTFNAGKFCYFVFYDPTTGDGLDATKRTGILYLTGNENSVTRQYDILALDGNSTSFSPYIHPKTQALYAYISLESAARAARIPSEYKYNGATKEYTPTAYFRMNQIEALAGSAETYYKNGSSWSSTDPTAYMELASTVQEFVRTVETARIYIADDVSEVTGEVSGGRVYKEGSYRDDVFKYQERWVNRLTSAYDDAVALFGNNSAQTNAATLRSHINEINSLIAAPILDWNPQTVQIIVDDQLVKDKDEDTGNVTYKGNWGKSNIHLWNCDDNGNNWTEVKYDLFDTTQSSEGFYAYCFKLKLDTNNYMISQTQPEEGSKFKQLDEGRRYTFHTGTGDFEADNSIMTYKITDDEITQGSSSGSYSWFDVREGDKSFAVQFMYDTKITYSGDSYTVRAGVYTINASYPGYTTDLEGISERPGINFFGEKAKAFFEEPKNYGMSSASSTSYSTWDEDIDDSDNIDLMINRINKSSHISASTSPTKKIAFRYKANKDDDTLTLKQKVSLEGGTVTIAANQINLSSYDFTIKAKTVVFLTDTKVVTTSHGTVTVPHGTYSLNESDSGTDFTISLQETGGDPDWRDHFTLISDTPSKLRGGYYITHE